MASQPLETIPEEPTASVTAKPKSPGRVAAGKRLAERNRLAREAKKKAEADAVQPSGNIQAQAENTNKKAYAIVLLFGEV